uniref:CARDB domain-containing protein n=1 Tax=Candidatus Electronema sp. TaxID=2698783 RepID=UPI00405668E6
MKKTLLIGTSLFLFSANSIAAGCRYEYIELYTGSIGIPGTSTPPTDPPASGKLPDFITSKVTMGSKDGKHEKYTWKINETAYVHDYIDNIGTADWEGKAKKIKVPFYLSKGTKEDSHSEWVRVSRQEIKKEHLKVKDKPKHEYIKFNLAEWANDSTVLPGRTYNFVVCADRPKDENNGDGDVKEKHKSNNCSTEAVFYVDFGPARNVDLIADNLALTGGRTELQAGEKYGLQVEVSNIGTEQPWNGFRTKYEIKGPGTGGVWQKIGDEHSKASSLYAGAIHFESMTGDDEVSAPMVGGDYVFRACADYEQVVPETDESNNCTDELPVYIAPPPMPDLITEGLQLTHGRTSLIAGELYGLTVAIRNIGNATPSSNIRSSYAIKGPGTGDAWQQVADDGSDADQLYPGAAQWEEITDEHGAHIPNVAGTYTARACADYHGSVPESDENNNCSEMTFEVQPVPACVILNPLASLPTTGSFDLAATSIEFPDVIQQGDEMHPKAQLCGVSGTSPRTRATWAYANCDGTGFTVFDGDTDDGLSAGECVTEENKEGDDLANMPPGRYVMYFIANGETQVPESDHSNNVTAKVFVVE